METILLIDDHPIVLRACAWALEGSGHRLILASSILEGFGLYRAFRPRLIITDLSFSGSLSGLSLIRRLRRVDRITPILVFSMHTDPVVVSRALSFGATGYISKFATPEEFHQAQSAVGFGRRYICHDIASQLAFVDLQKAGNPLRQLTSRERHMLSRIVAGYSYVDIADELKVSYKTVANTASLIKTKLGARNLAELMRMEMRYGTVRSESTDRELLLGSNFSVFDDLPSSEAG